MRDERGGWHAFGEKTIYDNRWVRLGLVDVEAPNGERWEYHVVHLPRIAVALIVDDVDEVLMLWRYRFVTEQWGYELLGGLVDEGEDAERAAAREAAEESGWAPVGPAGEVDQLRAVAGNVTAPMDVFLWREFERVGEPTDAEEAGRVEWVPLRGCRSWPPAGSCWARGRWSRCCTSWRHAGRRPAGRTRAARRRSVRSEWICCAARRACRAWVRAASRSPAAAWANARSRGGRRGPGPSAAGSSASAWVRRSIASGSPRWARAFPRQRSRCTSPRNRNGKAGSTGSDGSRWSAVSNARRAASRCPCGSEGFAVGGGEPGAEERRPMTGEGAGVVGLLGGVGVFAEGDEDEGLLGGGVGEQEL